MRGSIGKNADFLGVFRLQIRHAVAKFSPPNGESVEFSAHSNGPNGAMLWTGHVHQGHVRLFSGHPPRPRALAFSCARASSGSLSKEFECGYWRQARRLVPSLRLKRSDSGLSPGSPR